MVVYQQNGFAAEYTCADSGQAKYGGWKQDGLREFARLRKLNKKARKKESSKALERQILAKVRVANGKTAQSHEEEKKNKKRKRTGNSEPINMIDPDLLYSSGEDSDSEEEDYGSDSDGSDGNGEVVLGNAAADDSGDEGEAEGNP